jgi:aminoglycoside phosphotransferase (APT) family kinase protein
VGLENLPGLSDTALGWATAAVPEDVVHVAPLGGGITNTKWVLVLTSGERLVMRWADPARWGLLGREHVRREVLACQLLVEAGLPVPVLIASDPDGISAGGPANLLTWRPGHSRLNPLSRSAIDALAHAAVAIHQQPVPPRDRPPTFTPRGLDDAQVPSWTSQPELWRQAIEVFHAGVPAAPHGLLHRDFHLGNTLWENDKVTGLIDWAETSWGPPDVDVAHMCSDFAMMHAPADADRFRTAYLSAGGRLDRDPDTTRFWTISDVLGFLPDPAHILPAVGPTRPDLSARLLRDRLEAFLAVTLAQGPLSSHGR